VADLDQRGCARLQLLGRLDLIEAQRLADGNVFAWIERRNTEHVRVAA